MLDGDVWAAIAFAVNESDSTCGPGRYSLTQLLLPLSQVATPVVNIQVQLFGADVSGIVIVELVWRAIICVPGTCSLV